MASCLHQGQLSAFPVELFSTTLMSEEQFPRLHLPVSQGRTKAGAPLWQVLWRRLDIIVGIPVEPAYIHATSGILTHDRARRTGSPLTPLWQARLDESRSFTMRDHGQFLTRETHPAQH